METSFNFCLLFFLNFYLKFSQKAADILISRCGWDINDEDTRPLGLPLKAVGKNTRNRCFLICVITSEGRQAHAILCRSGGPHYCICSCTSTLKRCSNAIILDVHPNTVEIPSTQQSSNKGCHPHIRKIQKRVVSRTHFYVITYLHRRARCPLVSGMLPLVSERRRFGFSLVDMLCSHFSEKKPCLAMTASTLLGLFITSK